MNNILNPMNNINSVLYGSKIGDYREALKKNWFCNDVDLINLRLILLNFRKHMYMSYKKLPDINYYFI